MSSRSQQGLPELGSAKHGLGYELNGEILGEDALAQDVLVLDEDAPSPLGGDLRLHPDEYVHSPGSSGRIATSGHGEGWTRPETSASRHNFISLPIPASTLCSFRSPLFPIRCPNVFDAPRGTATEFCCVLAAGL